MRLLFCILASVLITNTAQAEASAPPPNIVFILVDDLGWTDLGSYGSSFYDTPAIDGLATSGLRFTNAYAAGSVCSPTRASIMTGKYPARMATTDYFGAPQPDEWKRNTPMLPATYTEYLAHEEITLPEMLKQKDYATFFAGKWHLGPEGYWPKSQGFDVNKGGITRGGPYGGKKYFSPYGNPRLEDGPEGEHLPDRLAMETVQFMTDNKDKPFFAYLSFYSVHTPLLSRKDLKDKYTQKATDLEKKEVWGTEGTNNLRLVQDHAIYAGMVEAMDQAVGKVLKAIDDLELSDNTIVIFTSDNGGLSTSEGHPTSNLPLRAGKGWLYEGGIREPLIIRWPKVTTPGTVSHQTITSTDYFPTIAAMAGINAPRHDGVDLTPLLRKNKKLAKRPVFWHYPHYSNQGGRPGSAIRYGDWKLIEFFEQGTVELYNLKDDIGEHHNVVDAHPRLRAKLLKKLNRWRDDVDARYPTYK